MCKHTTLEACSAEILFEIRGYEISSETILGPKRCFLEARRDSFTGLTGPVAMALLYMPLVQIFATENMFWLYIISSLGGGPNFSKGFHILQ